MEPGSCGSLLRHIVMLRSLISERDIICAAKARVGFTMDSVGGKKKVEALWMI